MGCRGEVTHVGSAACREPSIYLLECRKGKWDRTAESLLRSRASGLLTSLESKSDCDSPPTRQGPDEDGVVSGGLQTGLFLCISAAHELPRWSGPYS